MKKLAVTAAGIAILLSATPLTATHRRPAECRIVHPSHYYSSQGRRFDRKYRRDHFLRFHARDLYRFERDRRRFDDRSRRYFDDRYRRRQYRRPDFYRFHRDYDRYRHRRFGHRPRIGVYFEF